MTTPQLTSSDLARFRHLAEGFYPHARGCNKRPDECQVCQKAIGWFRELPLQTLARVLEERPVQVATR